MKKIVLLFGLSVITTLIFAQEAEKKQKKERNPNEIQTLFDNDGYTSHGGYGAINMFYTQLGTGENARSAFVSGIKGAWIIDHTFEIGIDANSFISESRPEPALGNSSYMYTGAFGGILLAVNIFPEKPINLSIPVTLGAGGVSYMGNYLNYDEYYDYYPESVYAYFMVMPGLELQLNMTKFMRLAIHASYRYTSNIYMEYNINPNVIGDQNLMRGLNLGASLKFGKF